MCRVLPESVCITTINTVTILPLKGSLSSMLLAVEDQRENVCLVGKSYMHERERLKVISVISEACILVLSRQQK